MYTLKNHYPFQAYCMYLFGFMILRAKTKKLLEDAIQGESKERVGLIVVWRSEEQ